MRLLPHGKMIKNHLDPKKLKLPDAFLKMCATGFSGYLAFDAADSNGVLCYNYGKVVAALWQSGSQRMRGSAAIDMLFRMVQHGSSTLGFYRVDGEFMPMIQRVCQGSVEVRGQMMCLLDVGRLLSWVENDSFDGVLHLYTVDSAVLIFYLEGKVQGFFRDGDVTMVTDVDVAESIVLDRSCLVDIIHFSPTGETDYSTAGINLEKSWLSVWRDLNL